MSILVPERQPNRRAEEFALDIMPSEDGFEAAFDESMARNPTPTILRWLERQQYQGYTDEFGIEQQAPTPSRILTPDEANAEYGIEGELKFDTDTPEPIARQLRKLKQEEIERREVLRRSGAGFGTQLTAGLVASILDPVNIASAFVPVVSPARFAALAARYGQIGGRAIVGATEGAVGAALVEPIVYAGAQAEQADYDAVDSLVNLAFGTALGAGLHLGIYGLGRIGKSTIPEPLDAPLILSKQEALERASPLQQAIESMKREDQEAALRTAVAQVAQGEPVNVTPVLDAAVGESSPITQLEKLDSQSASEIYRVRDIDNFPLYEEKIGDFHYYLVKDPDGTPKAFLWLEDQGDKLRVIDIRAVKSDPDSVKVTVSGVNPGELPLGTRQVRETLKALRKEFPAAKKISGERVSGARMMNNDDYDWEPPEVEIPLPPIKTPDDLDLDGIEMKRLVSESPVGPPKELTDQIAEVEKEIGDLQSIMSDAVNESQLKAMSEIDEEGTMLEKAFTAAGACQIRNS